MGLLSADECLFGYLCTDSEDHAFPSQDSKAISLPLVMRQCEREEPHLGPEEQADDPFGAPVGRAVGRKADGGALTVPARAGCLPFLPPIGHRQGQA